MLTTRVWTAGKWLILAGALIMTYTLFAVAAARVALKTRDVLLPDLRGRTVNEANAVLAELGLRLKVEEGRRLDPKVPANLGRVSGVLLENILEGGPADVKHPRYIER